MTKKILLLVFTMVGAHTTTTVLGQGTSAKTPEMQKYDNFKKLIIVENYSNAQSALANLDANADPYSRGETPLWLAISLPKVMPTDPSYVNLIKELLARGADINSVHGADNETLLSLAQGKGFKAVVDLLTQPAVGPTPKKTYTLEEFVKAAFLGRKQDLAEMWPHISNHNATTEYDNEEMNALMAAAKEGWRDTISFLITQGVNVNAKNNNGDTPLIFAVRSKSPEVINTFFKSQNPPDINAANKQGMTPLMAAAQKNDNAMITALYQKGADPLLKDLQQKTALDYAKGDSTNALLRKYEREARTKQPQQPTGKPTEEEITKFLKTAASGTTQALTTLLDANPALLNATDADGKTALMYATVARNLDNLSFLLDVKKANLDIQDKKGNTALLYANHQNNRFTDVANKIFEKLLKNGANPNIANIKGITPIFFVIQNPEHHIALEIAKLLFGYGADLNKKVDGKSVMDFAQQAGNAEIVQWLQSKLQPQPSMNIDKKLKQVQDAIETEDPVQVKVLLTDPDIKSNINKPIMWQGKSTTGLIFAVKKNASNEIIDELINVGADIEGVDSEGDTALMQAVSNSNETLIKTLLVRGANIDHQSTKDGSTALMLAAISPDALKLIPLLLEAGADLRLKDHRGQTALDVSIDRHNDEATKLLKEAAYGPQQPPQADLGMVYRELVQLNNTLKNLHRAVLITS